jgi:ATP phosphoribosyltransferase
MNQRRDDQKLRLAIPSKGALERSTSELLAAAGLKVSRPNDRQYIGTIPSLPEVEVIFQRAADIFTKVQEGSVDLGITGYDIYAEESAGYNHVVDIYPELGFGRCELVLAVPDSWIGIVTKYPNLTREWLKKHQIVHFSLVDANGALEAAPKMGYADMIADVSSTGTTLRENRLKPITGAPMLKSQACIIANKRLLQNDRRKQEVTKIILDSIEAQLEAKKFTSITANIQGESANELGQRLVDHAELAELAGMRGPTVAKVYSASEPNWYAVTIVVHQAKWREAVSHLRQTGGTDITVFAPNYIFGSESRYSKQLADILDNKK